MNKFTINARAAASVVKKPVAKTTGRIAARVISTTSHISEEFTTRKWDLTAEDTIMRWMAANSVRCQFCDQAPENEMCVFHIAKRDHDLPEYSTCSNYDRRENWRNGIEWLRDQLGDKDSVIIDILTMETHPRGIRINTKGATLVDTEAPS